ncbi:MAG: HAD family phosphatase [Lachnospiraceae bacterium]|nr:HAD family phosphatase [Lachnospiraceae bacterium]
MIKGAIFDVDGTLLDSMFIWDTIGEDYLRSIGYTPKENLKETFKCMSLYQAACYYQTEYGVTLSVEEIMNGINRMIDHRYRYEVMPKSGVREFLHKLNDMGVIMCIATATDKPFVQVALERCGIAQYFSEIFTCTIVGSGKDEPFIYREALKHIGTEKSATVVFEDALYALKTAKADGFWTAAVYDVHEKKQEEVRALAHCYIKDFLNLDFFWNFASQLS